MASVAELIAELRKKDQERGCLIDILELWDVAKRAGYDSSDIKSFSFRPQFVTGNDRRRLTITGDLHPSQRPDQHWHNCVRLHNGDLKSIPLTPRPTQTGE